MQDRFRRLLTTVLIALATVPAAGCGIIPKKYKLEIRSTGAVSSELQALYVIVSRSDLVADALSSPTKYDDLASEKLSNNYTSFAVYRPQDGTWKEEHVGRPSPYVSHEIAKESIEIRVKHDLLGTDQYTLIVLAFYGSDGFELQAVDHASLDACANQVIDVSGGTLSLRDG